MFSFENCANLTSQSTVPWNIKLWLETPNKKILNGWWLPEESLSLSRGLPLKTVSRGIPFPRFEAWSCSVQGFLGFRTTASRWSCRCRRRGPTAAGAATRRSPSRRRCPPCPRMKVMLFTTIFLNFFRLAAIFWGFIFKKFRPLLGKCLQWCRLGGF